MSRPARGEWIENFLLRFFRSYDKSRPARGEWIENNSRLRPIVSIAVSPRKGRVD